ncbi:acyl-CoA synthetase [Kangiella sp. HZ709]|uniref:acyl-CoA synthetase n=1 Tax=Kangiella sp. HZ709 TaxID=2666328 RepID=UPI0012B0C35E|nr:acyl-CoA synthetase [Kangiella sp. HZ709]MRX26650.1 AMP-binding protein [Kangiella sp. HZ709]
MKYSFDTVLKQRKGEWYWDIPEYFNIADACVDQHSQTAVANNTALIIEDDQKGQSDISYASLKAKTSQFANVLKSHGIDKGERVLIRLPNQLEYPIAFFGTIKYGGIAVPTSTLLAASEVAYLAKDSAAKVLVTAESMWSELSQELVGTNIEKVILTGNSATGSEAEQSIQVLNFNQEIEKSSVDFSCHESKSDDAAYLVYTSGTTGYPKGVLHAHRALLGRLPASKYWFDLSETKSERIMHSGKFNWTYVLGSALMDPLLHGHTVIAYEGKNDATTWPNLIQKHQCSIFIGVPTIYRQIIQKTEFNYQDLPSLKHCMSAGEHLSDEMQEAWEKRFNKPIYEAIGMSEVSYYISQHKDAEVKPGAAGFVQPGHYVELLNESLKPVGAMDEGMISIREDDPGLFIEYWQQPEETARAKHDGWFFTGDYAKRDAQDYIWFLGRKDDIINSFGYRISPHEIERVIKTHNDVADCVALGEDIEGGKTLVVICVIPSKDSQLTEQELLTFGQANLAKYKAPKKVYLMQDFPRTKNGKVLRKQMIQQLTNSSS